MIWKVRKQLQLEINKTLIIPCKDEGLEFGIILKRFMDYIKEDTEIKTDIEFNIYNMQTQKKNNSIYS